MQKGPKEKDQDTRSSQFGKQDDEKQELLKRIYAWASKNTSEARQLYDSKYHWPAAVIKLLGILELSEGSIIALVGLSGVGKSSAQSQVAKALNERLSANSSGKKDGEAERSSKKAVNFKWPGYFDSSYTRILEFLKDQKVIISIEEAAELIAEKLAKHNDPSHVYSQIADVFGDEFLYYSGFKSHFSQAEAAEILVKGVAAKKPGMDPESLAGKLLGPSELKIVSEGAHDRSTLTLSHDPNRSSRLRTEGQPWNEYRSRGDSETLAVN